MTRWLTAGEFNSESGLSYDYSQFMISVEGASRISYPPYPIGGMVNRENKYYFGHH